MTDGRCEVTRPSRPSGAMRMFRRALPRPRPRRAPESAPADGATRPHDLCLRLYKERFILYYYYSTGPVPLRPPRRRVLPLEQVLFGTKKGATFKLSKISKKSKKKTTRPYRSAFAARSVAVRTRTSRSSAAAGGRSRPRRRRVLVNIDIRQTKNITRSVTSDGVRAASGGLSPRARPLFDIGPSAERRRPATGFCCTFYVEINFSAVAVCLLRTTCRGRYPAEQKHPPSPPCPPPAAPLLARRRGPRQKKFPIAARGRPIIVEWERDARHSAGLSLVRYDSSSFSFSSPVRRALARKLTSTTRSGYVISVLASDPHYLSSRWRTFSISRVGLRCRAKLGALRGFCGRKISSAAARHPLKPAKVESYQSVCTVSDEDVVCDIPAGEGRGQVTLSKLVKARPTAALKARRPSSNRDSGPIKVRSRKTSCALVRPSPPTKRLSTDRVGRLLMSFKLNLQLLFWPDASDKLTDYLLPAITVRKGLSLSQSEFQTSPKFATVGDRGETFAVPAHFDPRRTRDGLAEKLCQFRHPPRGRVDRRATTRRGGRGKEGGRRSLGGRSAPEMRCRSLRTARPDPGVERNRPIDGGAERLQLRSAVADRQPAT
ncbi:hypothetical protein EVAR_84794_1 [Eumeta japonica]|uniref:Uncharacterized protein n=1 Tax=Eumeta variegata TaxID=151549 RepID=A0A4C1U9F2_EUMVA|nr:hypothetical protein EVAR_84794_1 [Eumeta japonica]